MQMLTLLGAVRVNKIVQALVDPRSIPQTLKWSQRIPRVNAVDEEITARVIDTVHIADIIMEDAEAVVYNMGKIQYETTRIPKFKLGIGMNELTLSQFNKLAGMDPASNAGEAQMDWMRGWQAKTIQKVVTGVLQRIEQTMIMMLCDGVGFTYDRLGIKLTNPTWGLFSDLKAVSAVSWDVPATATPVQDLWTLKLVGAERYGVDFNRVTMSTAAFRLMIATTEFQNKAKAFVQPQITYATNLNLLNLPQQQQFAQNILGLSIEFYDARYFIKSPAGVESNLPFMPLNNVILTNMANDGNPAVWDFANGQIMEAVAAQLTGASVYGLLPTGYGPMGYVTLANAQLNPPGVVHWGVGGGWAR